MLPLRPRAIQQLRALRTITQIPTQAHAQRSYASPAVSVTSTRSNATAPLLSNIESSWTTLPAEEQYEIYKKLGELQKKDWKELTLEEKKAAYYVAFGPHGPRAPIHGKNHGRNVFLYTSATIGVAVVAFFIIRAFAPPPPRTMTREYQEASNEYLRSQNVNPIKGLSSEGYKGKGMVQGYGSDVRT